MNTIYVLKQTLKGGYKYMIFYGGGTSHACLIVLTNDNISLSPRRRGEE